MDTVNKPILPDGWSLEKIDEFNVLLSKGGESWRFSEGDSGTSGDFVFAFLIDVLKNGS